MGLSWVQCGLAGSIFLNSRCSRPIVPVWKPMEPLAYQFQARHDDLRPIIAALRTLCMDAVDSFCVSVIAFAGNHVLGGDAL
jgi:hypothetical protein